MLLISMDFTKIVTRPHTGAAKKPAPGIHPAFMFASVRQEQRGGASVPSPAGITGSAGSGEVTPAASGSLSQTDAMRTEPQSSTGLAEVREGDEVLGEERANLR